MISKTRYLGSSVPILSSEKCANRSSTKYLVDPKVKLRGSASSWQCKRASSQSYSLGFCIEYTLYFFSTAPCSWSKDSELFWSTYWDWSRSIHATAWCSVGSKQAAGGRCSQGCTCQEKKWKILLKSLLMCQSLDSCFGWTRIQEHEVMWV